MTDSQKRRERLLKFASWAEVKTAHATTLFQVGDVVDVCANEERLEKQLAEAQREVAKIQHAIGVPDALNWIHQMKEQDQQAELEKLGNINEALACERDQLAAQLEKAKEACKLYNEAMDEECTCYSDPDKGCRYCRKAEKADNIVAELPATSLDSIKAGVLREAAEAVENGRFLHNESAEARFGKEAGAMLRRMASSLEAQGKVGGR